MITSWNLLCEKCKKTFSTAFPEEDKCPYCGFSSYFSYVTEDNSGVREKIISYAEKEVRQEGM